MENNTTLVFLKAFCSRDKFQAALQWVKDQPRETRLWLDESKLWVMDVQCVPGTPAFEEAMGEINDAGWSTVGETLWSVDLLPLKDHREAIESLAQLAVERNNRAYERRHK